MPTFPPYQPKEEAMDNTKLKDSARGGKTHLLAMATGWGPYTFHSACGHLKAERRWKTPPTFTEDAESVTCRLCLRSIK